MKFKKFISFFITLFTVTTATAIFINTWIKHFSKLLKPSISKIHQEKIFFSDYGNISYLESKNKHSSSPILLLHPISIISAKEDMMELYTKLSKKHSVFLPDLPGCGNSFHSNSPYTTFLYIKSLQNFIDKIIQSPVKIITVGNSLGIAAMLEKLYPNKVLHVYSISPKDLNIYDGRSSLTDKVIGKILFLPVYGTLLYHYLYRREQLEEDYFYLSNIPELYRRAHGHHCYGKFLDGSIRNGYFYAPIFDTLNENSNKYSVILGEDNPSFHTIKNYFHQNAPSISVIDIENSYNPHVDSTESILNILF